MKRVLLIGVLALTPIVAEAQQASPERYFVHISGAGQWGSETVADTFPLTLYDETTQNEADYEFKRGGGVFEIGGGIPFRWWQAPRGSLSIGVSYAHVGSSDSSVAIRAQVPHPVVFNRPRLAETSSSGLERSENAVHFRAIYTYPLRPNIDLGFFIGPSILNVSQDLVTGITPGPEVPPYDQVEIAEVALERGSGTTAGINVGFEATYHLRGSSPLTRGLGFQVFYKYAGGTADIELNEDTVESKVGGSQFGAGVRFGF
jgi:hypothetical protein